ncbi:MAG: PqqD family protein [Acetatifactor sp.]|nr:PqqD family protein [Acetatifactor sp.]
MKRNENYILRELAGVPYLLPCGQNIADHKPGCKINETGVFLWQLLKQDITRESLLYALKNHYKALPEDLPGLEKDLDSFLNILRSFGMLAETDPASSSSAASGKYMKAGNLTIKLIGPPAALSENFNAFFCEDADDVHQTLFIRVGEPSLHVNGNVLLRSDDFLLIDTDQKYVLLFPSMEYVQEAHLSKDGSLVYFYCQPPFADQFRDELFHAIRFPFLYLAQRHDKVVLHSASLLYRNQAWLFSGVSGTGKSTHTNLWHERFQVPLINGDLNLLAWENGEPVIQGTPWCGTSGICDPGTYPLGGIILLKQAPYDRLEELSSDTKRLLVLQRLISPSWTPELYDCNLQFLEKLADRIYISRLHCTKEFSAAETMKKGIDEYLDSQSPV